MQFNLTHRKNSVCYGCPRHTGTCRKTCKSGQAEARNNAADRRDKLIEKLGAYHNDRMRRNALRRVQADRSGGR